MVRDRRDSRTMDLLNWQPPEPAVRFEEHQVRGATLNARICRAMAVALEECTATRDEVAERMSEYLGIKVSKPMLDAYVSEARDTHTINIVRFAALVHATHDWRLLSLLPELFGFAVVDERYVALIRAQQIREKATELGKLADVEERRARGIGQ
jgi:hypothetical protein